MSTGAPDPQVHDPERLRAVATLAALPDGDALALTRLQGMLGLTPGSLITRLRELDHAGYVRTERPAIEPRPSSRSRSPATAGLVVAYHAWPAPTCP